MNRLPLLALLLLVGAAPPALKSGSVAIIADAKAFLKTSCAAAKASCPQTTEILDGYLAVLNDALPCTGNVCAVADVRMLFERDRKLDERENELPPLARSADLNRPLLRVSLLVIGRAGAALTLADPKAVAPIYWNPDVEAPKMVEMVCLKYPALCAEARAVVQEAGVLRSGATQCEKAPCAFPEQERLAIAAEANAGDYLELAAKVDVYTLPIFGLISNERARIAQMLARTSASKLAELEGGEKALMISVDALEKNPGGANLGARVDALNARGAEVLKQYQGAAISSDRTLSLLGGDPDNNHLRDRVNASAARLASARARLIALKTAQGFAGSERTDAGAIGAVRTALAKAGDATMAIATLGAVQTIPRSVPIDRRPVPMAPPLNPSAPPILETAPGFFQLFSNARSTNPLTQADALRRMGLTRTVGDPSGRAPLVHTQKGSDTCAVVAQQEILMARGLLAKGDPIVIEAQLAAEAKSRGFYRHGTPEAYTADLLVDRGLIVTKQGGASLETLDAAVRRGGMIIANVDARGLWNVKAPQTLGHAIVITGAEIGRFNGKTLGYYINDSGSLKLGAGRFVPIEQFRKAWEGHTKSFAEVH